MKKREMPSLQVFQETTQLRFNDENLLLQALTHRSFANEHADIAAADNERLEFLGDAVLNFITGKMLYEQLPDAPEGDLTRLRAALVRADTLAKFAIQLRIDTQLRIGRGEELNGGRQRENVLCDAFEAVIGAYFLDQGIERVQAWLTPLLGAQLEQIVQRDLDKDPRSTLQARIQSEYNKTPQYHTVNMTGPDHKREFTVEVMIGAQVVGIGVGHSKQSASFAAAKFALDKLDRGELIIETPL